jgi:hypothetical protein
MVGSIKNGSRKLGTVVQTSNPSYLRDRDRKITNLRPAWAKLVRPYLKTLKVNKNKRARDKYCRERDRKTEGEKMRRYEYVYRLGDLKSETKPQCCFFSVN